MITLASRLEAETARHGLVRPPWVLLPGVHPYDIAWRMGQGEGQIMLWGAWAKGRGPGERAAALRGFGPVPADWAWWAADACGLLEPEEEFFERPFEEVRAALATLELAVEGAPSEE